MLDVNRIDSRLIQIRMSFGDVIVSLWCAYAPQTGLPEVEKDAFFSRLLEKLSTVPSSETLVVAGDLNGHVGLKSTGFEGLHGGQGYSSRNADGT